MPSMQWLIGAGVGKWGGVPSAHQPQPMRSLSRFLEIVARGQWALVRGSRSLDLISMAGELSV